MSCCKKNNEDTACQTNITNNYPFLVLIIFILLAIVIGRVGYSKEISLIASFFVFVIFSKNKH